MDPVAKKFTWEKLYLRLVYFLPVGAMINLVIAYWSMPVHADLFQSSINYWLLLLLAAVLGLTPWLTNLIRIKNWSHFFGAYRIAGQFSNSGQSNSGIKLYPG